jgi:hypothetical protein
MERELLDASNRLRTATSAMRDMLPTPIPEKAREVCPGCGTPRDIVTYFGQIPQYWVVNEGKCRECVLRPTRVAKGPQQPGNARAQKRARARRAS